MQILFIHGNYPAQFRHTISDLGSQNIHDLRFLTARKDPDAFPITGVKIEKYKDIETAASFTSQAQSIVNEQINRGEIIQSKLIDLASEGFQPKLIVFHGGNGLGLFLRQLAPKATIIGYFEWYFSKRCAKLIMGREDIEAYNYIHARNICTENEILTCSAGIVPTEWQRSQFPKTTRSRLTVIFDGVDQKFFKPADDEIFEKVVMINGENASLTIDPGELLLTYATRGMEPMRGFPEFMRALPKLLEKLPNLKVLIGGRDRSAYGPSCPTHQGSWKEMMINELPVLKNHERITYTGLMSYGDYRLMLQRTNLHCYFTLPFVTSWSLFEAAACGTPILCNINEATTGTVHLPIASMLRNIKDIHEIEGINKAISILVKKEKRISLLKEGLDIEEAKKKWMKLINKTIQAKNN